MLVSINIITIKYWNGFIFKLGKKFHSIIKSWANIECIKYHKLVWKFAANHFAVLTLWFCFKFNLIMVNVGLFFLFKLLWYLVLLEAYPL